MQCSTNFGNKLGEMCNSNSPNTLGELRETNPPTKWGTCTTLIPPTNGEKWDSNSPNKFGGNAMLLTTPTKFGQKSDTNSPSEVGEVPLGELGSHISPNLLGESPLFSDEHASVHLMNHISGRFVEHTSTL